MTSGYFPADCKGGTYLLSPAKVNIGLSVVGRQPDGFHMLESLFWPLSFGDEITILPSTELTVVMEWSENAPRPDAPLPSGNANVAWRTLQRLSFVDRLKDCIAIRKQIPMGSGLGGGSSNAGTLLRFLMSRYPEHRTEIIDLAPQIGSDIPFFMGSRPSWVTGKGERILELQVEPSLTEKLSFLLVFPPFGSDTKTVFQEFRKQQRPFSISQNPFSSRRVSEDSFFRFLDVARNDLAAIDAPTNSMTRSIVEVLRGTGCAYAGLTGSGSTCFGIFQSRAAQSNAVKVLGPFLRMNNCRIVSAETYVSNIGQ